MTKKKKQGGRPPMDVPSILSRIPRPSRAVVTAGMPYANGPLHIGHLAGAHVPADIHARWLGLLIGRENVLFVCGTDDHGSASDVAAAKAGLSVRDFIDGIHDGQARTLAQYDIGLDIYSGTSRPETLPRQTALVHDVLRRLHANSLLQKRATMQWFDPELSRFLADRLVRGTCPDCGYEDAYGDECSRCGHQHEATELLQPRSTLSGAAPVLRETTHWFLDMDAVSETLRIWLEGKKRSWRPPLFSEVYNTVLPAVRMERAHEPVYKASKKELPKHKMKYAKGGQIVLQFNNKPDMVTAQEALSALGVETTPDNEWAFRSITRDVPWGVPVPADLDPELVGKTLYVWPDSLLAPISFTAAALAQRGADPAEVDAYWRDPDAAIYQFLGQDNVFFYVLMQGAMWLGTQDDPHRQPVSGELQLTDIFSNFHLLVEGEKMSKSRGNFVTARELIGERGYTADQVRYYLALLGLSRKQSNFDFASFEARNSFLGSTLNAAFEKPIAAAHSQFGGVVPEGTVDPKAVQATERMVQRFVGAMQKAEYSSMLNDLENYARIINSQFAQHKPHDDRYPEPARRDALFTCFMVLKSLMIMLQPFTPAAMERLRCSLRLPEDVFRVDQLGTPIAAGHTLGEMDTYYPKPDGVPSDD